MKLLTIPVTMLQENTYFYIDEQTNAAAIIDPGGEAERLISEIENSGIKPCAILLTHGHHDHIGAVQAIAEKYNIKIYAHKDEAPILTNAANNFSVMRNRGKIEFSADVNLSDGDNVSLPFVTFKVIHTSGHTPGGACYYDAANAVIFTGDTLFLESIGRTDLTLGDTEALYQSIAKKLFTLPDNTTVYAGHGPKTSIGHERLNNPYVDEKGGK